MISLTDAESHTTTYTYASFFGLTKIEYPDSTCEEYKYSNMGSVTSFTDAKGDEITFTYDSIYRLTQIQYPDQSIVSFTYDLNSNRTRMDDDAPNTGDYVEYTYDYWNRLITEERHISTDTYTVSYQYDEASRPTKLTYPDTTQILYSYDDLNRMTEIKRYVDGINDEILLDNIQYNTESLLTQFDYGNDLRATFSYDQIDRISTINVKDGETAYLDLDFTWDNNSNITQIVNGWRDTTLNWHSDTETYSYDGLDRLTSASCTSWSHTYSYDKTGNITTKDSITYTINAVDEVTALSDGTTFTYDANGNRTQKTKGSDTWAYIYDYADRLTRIEKNQTTRGEYVYDGDGKRIQATENSVTTTSIYTGLDILYEENTTGTATYIYGPKGRIAKRTMINQETNIYYYHTDQLGSTRLVTDSNRNIVTAATYHPYGETYVEEGEEEDYSFTGKQKDSTGLYYFMGRYYDPGVGRFLTRDPKLGYIDRPQTLNRYIYCLNNPLKFVDPDGRECVSILVEESRSTAARAPSTKASTEDIMNFLAILCAGLAFLYFGPIGLLLGGGAIASAFIALCYIFTAISLTLTLLTVFFDYGPEITEDFINALDNFLESESLIRDNIDDTEYHLDGTITIVINEGEDTERRVTFKKTEEGWVVVEDTGEQDGGNEGGSSNDSGGEESSSPPLPINSPTTQ